MFNSGLKTIKTSYRDTIHDVDTIDIDGVSVAFSHTVSNSSEKWWTDILYEWIPRFNEHGWTNGLTRFEIGDDMLKDDGVGEYQHSENIIAFREVPELIGQPFMVSTDISYAIIHEMIHHIHLQDIEKDTSGLDQFKLMMVQNDLGWNSKMQTLFGSYVSAYAEKSFLEAVAETGAGIMVGEVYPRRVIEAYKELRGPIPFEGWNDQPTINDEI